MGNNCTPLRNRGTDGHVQVEEDQVDPGVGTEQVNPETLQLEFSLDGCDPDGKVVTSDSMRGQI